MDYSFKSSGPKTRPDRAKPSPPAPARSRSSSIASSASFASAVEAQNNDGHAEPDKPAPVRFSPEEEKQMVEASHNLKAAANKQFAVKDYSSAISTYDKALAELPVYLDYELAVLQSNVAACHLQLKEWKEAIESAERGLGNLERELPMPKPKSEKKKDDKSKQPGSKTETKQQDDDSKIIELPDDQDEEQTTELLKKLDISDQRKSDITRIRTKLLLRRARAKVMICDTPAPSAPRPASYLDPDHPTTTTEAPIKKPNPLENGSHWSNLSTALSDYQTLAKPEYFHNLPSSDQKTVIDMLRALPPRVEAAKKAEVDEMMDKLKQLGNGILKPFGLSTDMFKMVQDPNTGGWSMNFDQNSGKS